MSDLSQVLAILPESQAAALAALENELADTWAKKQIFRTETEARLSVLNEGKHPTPASKYWQAVREQAVMLENLTAQSFELRRLDLKRRRLEARLAGDGLDDFAREEITIDLDECQWQIASVRQVAGDRAREILMWSGIKKELDDGSFDTRDPGGHQMESLPIVFARRASVLTEHSSFDDRFNALSLHHTAVALAAHSARLTGEPSKKP